MPLIATNHIESNPQVWGGRTCIVGTRIRVQDIYVWHELQGQSPEEIVTNFSQLTLADGHASLVYYDHRGDIETEVLQERIEAEQMNLSHPSRFLKKFTGRYTDSISS